MAIFNQLESCLLSMPRENHHHNGCSMAAGTLRREPPQTLRGSYADDLQILAVDAERAFEALLSTGTHSMKWHPFKPGEEYPVAQIIDVLKKDAESGRLGSVSGKWQLIELYEPHEALTALFKPFGGTWGDSPYNPNAWKRIDGSDLIPGYRQPRKRKPFSKQKRKAVMLKTNSHCYSCGQKFTDASKVWIEHIIAFSVGGSDDIENLLPGCRICNYTRQNFSPHQIQRILSVGSLLVREIDKQTQLGQDMLAFVKLEDTRRKAKRKHADYGFLIFDREKREADTEA